MSTVVGRCIKLDYILEMKAITKRFGTLLANDHVNFNLKAGEIHALLGENGAGKTTLMNILYGIYKADEGKIYYKGNELHLESPKDAINIGIGMVHQHFMLVPAMTVLENIILGQTDSLKKMDLETPRREIQKLCDTYNFRLDLDSKVCDLSVGAQQRVELVKVLYRGADVLILDEPTAVLTPQEVSELFEILCEFIKQGKSIIIISHKLWEVKRFSDRCTVLHSGKIIDTVVTADVEEKELATMMVGKSVNLQIVKNKVTSEDTILTLENIYAEGFNQASSLKNISFNLHRSEILGIAGVDGNGQQTLGDVMMNLCPLTAGRLIFNNSDFTKVSTRNRINSGFAYIPEDRLTQGLILDFTLSENYILNCYKKKPFTTGKMFFHPNAVSSHGEKLTSEYDVRPCNSEVLAKSLSGGNQQKVILARELSSAPKVIVAMQPTRGLDICASEFLHLKLLEAKNNGAGILLISTDLDELILVCDRILVINEGSIMGEFVPGEVTFEEIGLMMGGIKQRKEEAI